jgi:hypothetical protein
VGNFIVVTQLLIWGNEVFMKKMGLFGGCGLAVAMLVLVSAAQAERPSQSVLAEMGLGGLQEMSDVEALAIRGHGFRGRGASARAWGNSEAEINLPFGLGESESENGYSSRGRRKASGRNKSVAGLEIELEAEALGGNLDFEGELEIKVKVYAGGYSSARAF